MAECAFHAELCHELGDLKMKTARVLRGFHLNTSCLNCYRLEGAGECFDSDRHVRGVGKGSLYDRLDGRGVLIIIENEGAHRDEEKKGDDTQCKKEFFSQGHVLFQVHSKSIKEFRIPIITKKWTHSHP